MYYVTLVSVNFPTNIKAIFSYMFPIKPTYMLIAKVTF